MSTVGMHLHSGCLAGASSKATSVHTHIHTFMAESTSKATARSSGAVRVGGLAQGHLDPPRRGAGDRTGDLPVASQRGSTS